LILKTVSIEECFLASKDPCSFSGCVINISYTPNGQVMDDLLSLSAFHATHWQRVSTVNGFTSI